MNFNDYKKLDAIEMAKMVANGDVSSDDLIELSLHRMSEVNPRINAIAYAEVRVNRADINEPKGIFHGVPFLIKDQFAHSCTKIPVSFGNKALKNINYKPEINSTIVNRWLDSGVIIIGSTCAPEFSSKTITSSDAWGVTRNPWSLLHTPGGSSGGAAAAVSSGIVPMAGASDTGGSIRIPASYCGLFGLKPGRGRTPTGPEDGEFLHGWTSSHVLTRSVRDSAAMLDVTHGYESASTYLIKPPEDSYLCEVQKEPKKLKIGYYLGGTLHHTLAPDARKSVEAAMHLLKSLGHEVLEVELPINDIEMATDFLNIIFATTAVGVDYVRNITGCSDDGFEEQTLMMSAVGRALTSDTYAKAYQRTKSYTATLGQYFDKYDLLLMPTTNTSPAKTSEFVSSQVEKVTMKVMRKLPFSNAILRSGIVHHKAIETLSYTPFTKLANICGLPAMTVPLYWTDQGLPMSPQFVAPIGGEGLLFQLAGQIERAQPWFDLYPSL